MSIIFYMLPGLGVQLLWELWQFSYCGELFLGISQLSFIRQCFEDKHPQSSSCAKNSSKIFHHGNGNSFKNHAHTVGPLRCLQTYLFDMTKVLELFSVANSTARWPNLSLISTFCTFCTFCTFIEVEYYKQGKNLSIC